MRPDTVLVSVMTVNNEIGVRQPVEDIGKHASSYIIKWIYMLYQKHTKCFIPYNNSYSYRALIMWADISETF